VLEWAVMSREEKQQDVEKPSEALVVAGRGVDLALLNAIHLWAAATTDSESACCEDLLKAKRQAVSAFFAFSGKDPGEVSPLDVQSWRQQLEVRGFKPATVYARVSRLSSFYEWAMKDPALGQFITSNPARLARPKCPRPYQTESAKALDDEKLAALFKVVREKAETGLRGSDVELKKDDLIVRCRVKGGDYVGRAINEVLVRDALLDYLSSCDRTNALGSNRPLWTRHDKAGRPGAPLSSHSFDKNLKRYAREAGIEKIHIHQTRHTFARIISEETGSIVETQDALGHKSLSTTRVYIGRIAVKRDKHSRQVTARLKLSR
jgi:integrase